MTQFRPLTITQTLNTNLNKSLITLINYFVLHIHCAEILLISCWPTERHVKRSAWAILDSFRLTVLKQVCIIFISN